MTQNPSQMAISPLQLKSHFFPLVHVVSMPGGKGDGPTTFNQDVGWSAIPDKPNEWRLQLGIKLASADKAKPFLYEIDVQAIGHFEVIGTIAEDRKMPIAVVNGLSILFGAIREMVLNITARQAYGPVNLPSVSFIDVLKLPEDGTSSEIMAGSPPPGSV